jgi:hypothetical protein
MSMSPQFVRQHKKPEVFIGGKRLRRKSRLDQAAANEFAFTELIKKQLALLERYRPALDRIANEENWGSQSNGTPMWLGDSHPLTIAQEAIKLELPAKAKEEPNAIHSPIPSNSARRKA